MIGGIKNKMKSDEDMTDLEMKCYQKDEQTQQQNGAFINKITWLQGIC